MILKEHGKFGKNFRGSVLIHLLQEPKLWETVQAFNCTPHFTQFIYIGPNLGPWVTAEFCHWLLQERGLACSKEKKKRRKEENSRQQVHLESGRLPTTSVPAAQTKAGEWGAAHWAQIVLTLPWFPRLLRDECPHHCWGWKSNPMGSAASCEGLQGESWAGGEPLAAW